MGLLANTNISDLAFVNQLFKLLPRRIGIRSQLLINDGLSVFQFLLERDWPAAHPSTLEMATGNHIARTSG